MDRWIKTGGCRFHRDWKAQNPNWQCDQGVKALKVVWQEVIYVPRSEVYATWYSVQRGATLE